MNKSVRSDEYKFRTAKRSMDMIRRLIYANFNKKSMRHIVLTFDSNLCNFDITDVLVCNKMFSRFIHRIRVIRPFFKYIKVAEFTKKGVVHFHMVCNVAFLPSKVIAKYWSYGFVSVSKADHSISRYMFKYLLKGVSDPRFYKCRFWSRSSNLIKPVSMYGDRAYSYFRDIVGVGYPLSFTYKYVSPNIGKVCVFEYNLDYSLGNFSKGFVLKGGENR